MSGSRHALSLGWVITLTLLLASAEAGARVPDSSARALAGTPAPPAVLAGVDLAICEGPALYPGGTVFAVIGNAPVARARIVDREGRAVRSLDIARSPGSIGVFVWDGRDASGLPFRTSARLSVETGAGLAIIDLLPMRGSRRLRAASGVRFTLQAVSP